VVRLRALLWLPDRMILPGDVSRPVVRLVHSCVHDGGQCCVPVKKKACPSCREGTGIKSCGTTLIGFDSKARFVMYR